ncbi:hypothetical protein SAMN05892883_2055 [Jatrophihabitans sp. GAS493]|uniref:hypothetical protein n=1 Tax=Jatrophihabitans sp. GAS493 TaxID=1907575 RepID=UPI000BC0B89A|nr:hypothetical protein [Jatrophihabitans sp. GAS493]SOD72704.1 hypothetical protein SAMN05892883_2055 [Jatrophihabitans sp. GAS493]
MNLKLSKAMIAPAIVGALIGGGITAAAGATSSATTSASIVAGCTTWTTTKISCVKVTPAPTPAPAPASGSATPPAPPSSTPAPTPVVSPSGFPDASNTGPTGALTAKSGDVTVAAGATLSNVDISGAVTLKAGAKLINSKVRCIGESNWCLSLGANDTVTNVEVGGGVDGSTYNGAIGIYTGGPNNVLSKVNIHHTSDGIRLDGGTTLQDSYIHDLVINQIPGVHSDGIQMTQATAPVVLTHNSFQGGTNDAVFVQDIGSQTISATGNLFTADDTGGNQTSYGFAAYTAGHVTLTGNVFGSGWEVTPYSVPSGSTVSGNVNTAGKPI